MKRYWKYIKPYWGSFLLAPLLMLTEVFGEIMLPKLMSLIINNGVANRDTSYIIAVGGVMVVTAFVMAAGGIGAAYFSSKASICFSSDLRKDVFDKVQQFSFKNIDDFSSGSLVTRLTNDIQQIQNVLMMSLRMMFRAPGMLIGGLIMAYLMNRSLFETDLRTLQSSEYDSMVCTYIDVVGLHEINNHLGHRSGDAMLCFIANAARKFFVSSRIYRIGGDEFVILTPNQPPYSVWVAVDKMRAFLRAKEYEISVGIQSTNDLHRLDDAMNQAEAAMRQDKQAYYARNGQERQLRGLNEKLEQTLTEKRDAEHFLRVLAPKYKSVFVVDLKTDRMRGVIVPDYFQKILDTSGGSFLAVLQQYRDTQVQPAYRESLADLLDYNYIRSKVLTGDIVEHTYKKTDDTTFRVKVTPYSRSGSHIDETLWIFSDEGASLTPPQTK